jgi:hypothetical protein
MAFAWGLLEAISLFLVPDTWISRQALLSLRAGLIAAAWALVGALIGGMAVYWAATLWQEQMLAFYDWLPGIGPTLVAKADAELQARGVWALFNGGYTGTPYKLFAAQANAAGIGPGIFVLVSVLSRGSRFIAAAFVAWLVGAAGRVFAIRHRVMLWVHFLLWGAFYAAYWTVMAG